MRHNWPQFALIFLISLSLVGAPCRDCQPKQKRAHCSHSCCPKPQPDKGCAWQPANVDTLDTHQQIDIEAPLPEAQILEVASPAFPVAPLSADDQPDASPPPLYVAHQSFLI